MYYCMKSSYTVFNSSLTAEDFCTRIMHININTKSNHINANILQFLLCTTFVAIGVTI